MNSDRIFRCEQCNKEYELKDGEYLNDRNYRCKDCWEKQQNRYPAGVAQCLKYGDYEGACLARDEYYYHGYC